MKNKTFPNDGIDRDVAEVRRALDLDDLQNEIAGRETGRTQRFLGKGSAESQAAERRKYQDQAHLTALQMLLQNDPEYAALYRDTMDLLRRAENATEEVLTGAARDLSKAQGALGDTLDSANKLADGTVVFKDANGNVWTAEGRLIEDEELGGIVWKEGAASYEDYLRQKQAVEDAQQRINDLRRYQTDVLGHARDRLSDEKNPASKDVIGQAQSDIQDGLDNIVNHKKTVTSEADVTAQRSSDIHIPAL